MEHILAILQRICICFKLLSTQQLWVHPHIGHDSPGADTQSSHHSGGVFIYPGISVSSISISMELLQTLWLWLFALFAMNEIYRSDSGYIDMSYIVNIRDHL